MKTWVRADVDFGMPMAVLTLPLRDMPEGFLSKLWEAPPELIQGAVQELISRHRPEWAGGTLVAMSFSVAWAQWEFLYAHPDFPRVGMMRPAEKIPLIPEGKACITST